MRNSGDHKRDRNARRLQGFFLVLLLGCMALAATTGLGKAEAAEAGGLDSPRFAPILDGAAVEDKLTGLIWEQEPDSFHGTWMEAAVHCREKSVAGQTGWRIPTAKELFSLTDSTQRDPALPAGHPFSNVKSAIYWSATPSTTDDMVAWHVSFFTGEAVTDQKSQTRRAWCVREGQGGTGAR